MLTVADAGSDTPPIYLQVAPPQKKYVRSAVDATITSRSICCSLVRCVAASLTSVGRGKSFKPCNRCGAVNVAPRTGTRSKEPYLTLAQYRRQQGKVKPSEFVAPRPLRVWRGPCGERCLSPSILQVLFGALFSRAQLLEGGRQVLAVGARVVPAPQ